MGKPDDLRMTMDQNGAVSELALKEYAWPAGATGWMMDLAWHRSRTFLRCFACREVVY
jgi:hypothetical protein